MAAHDTADAMASTLMGDTLYVNPMILGYAWQKGWIPLDHASLMRAIELNGVAVEANRTAFAWGRQAAHDWPSVQRLLIPAQTITFHKPADQREPLDQVVERRATFLTAYQNAAYADSYRAFVARVQAAEAPLGQTSLSDAVARNLFKLMAYKDEYEVARLHTDPAFTQKLADMFEGDYRVVHHMAPPLTAQRNDKGELVKKPYGPWMRTAFTWLARLKGLRGGALDIFGKTEERRTERALITEYRACIEELLAGLNASNLALAVQIARIPEDIRGYGHVKERHLKAARPKWDGLMAQWRGGQPPRHAA